MGCSTCAIGRLGWRDCPSGGSGSPLREACRHGVPIAFAPIARPMAPRRVRKSRCSSTRSIGLCRLHQHPGQARRSWRRRIGGSCDQASPRTGRGVAVDVRDFLVGAGRDARVPERVQRHPVRCPGPRPGPRSGRSTRQEHVEAADGELPGPSPPGRCPPSR